jgi:hypothetical protein
VLVLASEAAYLFDFGGGHIFWVNTAKTHPFPMDFEHDPCGLFAIHPEKSLQDDDDEIHRCVIVIQEQDLE